ncbi:MAG: efflux RND transporter periplasmic adaptor subunit [Spirosomataceae bacterium]
MNQRSFSIQPLIHPLTHRSHCNSMPKSSTPITTGLKLGSFLLLTFWGLACHKAEKNKAPAQSRPVIQDQGTQLSFPDAKQRALFKTEAVHQSLIQAELSAPARIVATVLPSVENKQQNLVLFDNPDNSASFTALMQHIINVNQKKIVVQERQATIAQRQAIVKQRQAELARFQELAEHGAATGKDIAEIKIDINNEETNLLGAQADLTSSETELANEKTAILEHEAKLKLAGFEPSELIKASANTVWMICDVPENQITRIQQGGTCIIRFTSFPEQKFTGKIEEIGDVVDNITRMVKLRIRVLNPTNQLRAGMFASVSFGITEGNYIAVPKEALVTVQNKHFVFVVNPDGRYVRKEVMIGQQINDKVIIFSGLQENDAIAVTNVLQLKGLSFGY